jgi:hypothetical protein
VVLQEILRALLQLRHKLLEARAQRLHSDATKPNNNSVSRPGHHSNTGHAARRHKSRASIGTPRSQNTAAL